MNARRRDPLLAVLVGVLAASQSLAQTPVGTVFTYQGRLAAGGVPAAGPFDLQLILYDAPAGGSQVGPLLTIDDVTVTEGLFTVPLDFGPVFAGSKRWLEIGVRPGPSTGGYAILSPRQELTAGPGALYSSSAPWTGVTGKPPGFADDIDNDTTYSPGAGISIAGTVISVAPDGVTSAMILDGTVTAADLAANSVGSSQIAPNAVTSAHIALDTITAADIAPGAVTASEILDGTITSIDIANGAVTSADIATGAVTGTHIATGAVTGTHIAASAVSSTHIALGAVNTSHILDNTITATDIAPAAVTRSEISGGEVPFYQVVSSGCGGAFSLSSTCLTQLCAAGTFWSCGPSPTCNQGGALPCPNTLVGYLLSPSIP